MEIEPKEVKLEIERVAHDFGLPANWDSEVHRSETLAWVLSTWAMMPTQQMQRYEVRYPAGWVEAVKERWMPGWMARRWPVRYERRVFDAREAYPDYKLEWGGTWKVLIEVGDEAGEEMD